MAPITPCQARAGRPDPRGYSPRIRPKASPGAHTKILLDWICEILSPGTRRFDLTEKRELYGSNGVAHLWLVDPEARTLEAFTLTAAFQDGDDIRVAPFEALTFPLNALWPD